MYDSQEDMRFRSRSLKQPRARGLESEEGIFFVVLCFVFWFNQETGPSREKESIVTVSEDETTEAQFDVRWLEVSPHPGQPH